MRARHAGYFRALANRMDAALRAGEPEEGPVAVLAADIGNLRAAAESGLDAGDTQLVREITAALQMYWLVRGLYTEARSWLDRALALDDAQDRTRQRLLSALGTIAYGQGDHLVAVAASDEAASLAMQLGGETERFEALRARATAARRRGDLEAAGAVYRDALDVALAVDNGVGTSSCRLRPRQHGEPDRPGTTRPTSSWPRTCRSCGPGGRPAARGTRSPAWLRPRWGAAGPGLHCGRPARCAAGAAGRR